MAAVREDVVKIGFDVDMAELKKLNGALDDTKQILTGGMGNDAFDEMVKESKKAAEGVEGIKEGLDGIKPDGLEDTNDALGKTKKEGEKAHDKLKQIANQSFGKAVSGLKSIVTTLGKVGIAAGKMLAKGIAAGAAGVGALVAQSVKNYADYEQLVGGVDTLFKDSSGTVQKYADNAFKTAGLSANDYMSTVTSFSASLIQSLGGNTGAAAELANMAIIDMSDNANKMGTDMGSIQDAYQGFAKQNYTMLDNLKLGYGGTQEEMKRLLADAQKLSGQKFDISSYADVVKAIHVIQENMGIAGTTAKEASETISGSWSSLKSAWSNTLTALILGGDDFDRCIDNLVDSAKTFGKNIMPAIQKALDGVGALITELAPMLEKELPGIIKNLLPPLLKAATSLVKGLIVALPDIISTLIDELPTILSEVWSACKDAFGEIPGMAKAEAFFGKLKTWFTDNAATIKKLVPAILGVVFALKLFNKIKGITGLFGGGGGAGGGGFFGSLANMNTGVVLKGLGNLAIIIGGLAALAALLMWAAPYMAKLSDLKSIGEVLLVMGLVGLLGTAMTKLSGSVGMIPVATVAKGLANIAIVMVGFGALAAVLMWLAPYMAELSDIQTLTQIIIIIGGVGLVGSALAALAGIVGMIPIQAVLMGLVGIAAVLAGFTLIAVAFGALTKVDGFTDLLETGGEVLADICGIIGDMAGSIVGGFAEGVTDSLPAIGENLSAFATAVKPMLDTFSSVDATGFSDFATAMAAFVAVIAGDALVNAITGGVDYAGLGTNLNTMASNMSGFFSTIMTLPEGGFEKATALFDCLAGIKGMPKEGGVVGWFQGEVDFTKIATGITQLAGAAGAFTTIQAIPDEAMTKMSTLFDTLAGIKNLPDDNGVVGWFMGSVDFNKIATGIETLASDGMITAIGKIQAIPAAGFTALTNLFNAIADIKELPSEGGVKSWFTGDTSTTLTNITSKLPGVATDVATFFANLGGITDFTPIKSLFETLGGIEIDTDAADEGFLGLGKSDLETIGSGLSSFATSAKTFFDTINGLSLENLNGFFDTLGTAGDLPDTLSTLDSSVGTSLSNLVTTADTKLTELKGKFSDRLGEIVALMNTTATAMYSSGVAIMQGVNNGMESMRATLVATAASIAAAIQAAFDVTLDINSPSRETYNSGVFVGEGYDLGMQSKIPDLEATASKMGEASIPYANHYSPDSDSSTVTTNRTSTETVTISPTFNLTVSGTQDDRATARKVKQWVNDAMNEFFESLDRKTPEPREA